MFKNIIKLGKVISTIDTGAFQKITASFLGKIQDVKRLNMYGFSSVPPKGSIGLLFSRSGYEDDIWFIPDFPSGRFKGLKEGEVKFGNTVTGGFVYFKADGTVEVYSSKKVLVTAPDVEIVASTKVTITSPLVQVSGIVEASDFKSPSVNSYDAHTHSGVTAGGANTGGPT